MSERAPDRRFYLLRDAARSNLIEAERLIREDPAVLEARSGLGETALHFLIVEHATDAVEFLRSKGALIDPKNDFGDTPLMDAASLGYLDLCRYLVGHGADYRYVSSEDGESAYSRAAAADKIDVLEYLLSLLSPGEDLHSLVPDLDAEMIFECHPEAAQLLAARGLVRRWPNENP